MVIRGELPVKKKAPGEERRDAPFPGWGKYFIDCSGMLIQENAQTLRSMRPGPPPRFLPSRV